MALKRASFFGSTEWASSKGLNLNQNGTGFSLRAKEVWKCTNNEIFESVDEGGVAIDKLTAM